jgi:hypothetical protein
MEEGRTDLTQQMLADYKRFIKPERWEAFEKREREDVAERGPIVNIKDVYSADGTQLLKRIYQREYQVGTDSGSILWCANAGVKNLNMLRESE